MRQSQNSSNQFEAFLSARLPRVPVGQLKFQSASEYACARLLEQHCGWKAYPGNTFQIPIGRCFFDFRVGNCLVEYHPISLRHELLTNLLGPLQSASKTLKKEKKIELLEAVTQELKAQYIKRRGQVASAHSTYRDSEVVCCFSPEDFISLVVYRHLTGPTVAFEDLVSQFRKAQIEGRNAARER